MKNTKVKVKIPRAEIRSILTTCISASRYKYPNVDKYIDQIVESIKEKNK
jgi:hypothetical protein